MEARLEMPTGIESQRVTRVETQQSFTTSKSKAKELIELSFDIRACHFGRRDSAKI